VAKNEKPKAIIIELTGVAKYINSQENLPKVSRVSKYLARQSAVSKPQPVIMETGVDRYMRHRG